MKSAISLISFSIFILIYFGLLLIPLHSLGQASEADQKLESFLTIAEDLFSKAELPGAGIAIVYGGEVLYTGGLGFANLQQQTPVTEHTLFFIGSTTKAFTGFAAAKLVEKQLLAWKTPIINYLPDFSLSEPYVAKQVNLEDLFTHMTGLARKDELWEGKPLTREEVYEQATKLEFTHGFREAWDYNNHAYVIIGKVLEAVSDTPWESLIQQEILTPLGMTHSYVTYQDFLADSEHVTGYLGDGKTERPHINPNNIGPAGAIASTPHDISKWLQVLVNKGNYQGKQLISPKQFDYLTGPKGMSFTDTCTVSYYSIGWGGLQKRGKRTLRHSGGIAGNSARVSVMPDDGFGIFILTNQASDYKGILTDYAESIFVNGDFKRDIDRERKLISYNRFIQFQNLLLDRGIEPAKHYHATLQYKDFESNMIYLGQALLDAGYLEHALFVFELTVSDHPNSYKAHDSYAHALAKDDDIEEAVKMYKKSLDLNPENEPTRAILERLLKQ